MVDIEMLKRGLRCIAGIDREDLCRGCRYGKIDEECDVSIAKDVLSLLKEQEAKWVEDKQGEVCRLIRCSNCGLKFIVGNNIPYNEWIEDRDYCRRCGARMVKPND